MSAAIGPHPPGAGPSSGLIVLAVLLTGGLYALAGLGKAGNLPANIGPFLAIIFGLLLVAHLAMRRLAPNADPILLPTAGLLNGIGYVFIARLSSHEARLQAVWTALGIAAFIVTLLLVRRARDLERYRYSLRLRRHRAAAASAGTRHRRGHQRRPPVDPRRLRSTSSPARSPSWRWPSSSPRSWSSRRTCSAGAPAGSAGSWSSIPAIWPRSWPPGACRC